MKTMYVYNTTDDEIINMIQGAKRKVTLYTPGVSLPVAKALVKKVNQFKLDAMMEGVDGKSVKRRFQIALDVSENTIKLGLNEAEAIKLLWVADTEFSKNNAERWFYYAPNLRLGILTVDDQSLVYSPVARKMEEDYEGLEGNSPNSFYIDTEILFSKEYLENMRSIVERLVNIEDVERLCGKVIPTRIELETKVEKQEEEIKQKEEEIEQKKEEIKQKDEEIKKKEEEIKNIETTIANNPPVAVVMKALSKFEDCVTICSGQLRLKKVSVKKMTLKIPSEFLVDAEIAARCSSGYEILEEADIEALNKIEYKYLSKESEGHGKETKTEVYTFQRLEEELEDLRKTFFYSVGNATSVIKKSDLKKIQIKLEMYKRVAAELYKNVKKEMIKKITINLEKFYENIQHRVSEPIVSPPKIEQPFMVDIVAAKYMEYAKKINFKAGRPDPEFVKVRKFHSFIQQLSCANKSVLKLIPPELTFETLDFPRNKLYDEEFQKSVCARVIARMFPEEGSPQLKEDRSRWLEWRRIRRGLIREELFGAVNEFKKRCDELERPKEAD